MHWQIQPAAFKAIITQGDLDVTAMSAGRFKQCTITRITPNVENPTWCAPSTQVGDYMHLSYWYYERLSAEPSKTYRRRAEDNATSPRIILRREYQNTSSGRNHHRVEEETTKPPPAEETISPTSNLIASVLSAAKVLVKFCK